MKYQKGQFLKIFLNDYQNSGHDDIILKNFSKEEYYAVDY